MMRALCFALVLLPVAAAADSFPPGVTYPLTPAQLQPAGLAQPLPSSRRYVMVWKDQLIPDNYSDPEINFVVTHYVGTQKLFKRQIDQYRAINPNFLMLTYHLAFGLNGADQPNPVGNITAPDTFGQEDTDTFTPYVAAQKITRENAYQHDGNNMRVSYPDPYWLMDIGSNEWRNYLFSTLIDWQAFPTAHSTGMFLDVSFPPWYNYLPANWWTGPAGGSSRQALDAWWMPRAKDYFDAMRTAFSAGGQHPRYLVIPNPDALVDGTDEPTFLDGTDGVFTENWQSAMGNPGDWNLSARRICQYVTSVAKVWMADVTQAGTDLSQSDREMIIGSYLLIRNGTSYLMLGNGDLTWYPEYEIDLGAYVDEPPADLEGLRVAGAGGGSGGLYARKYVSGLVLVNTSQSAQSYALATGMKQAKFSGGGMIGNDASLPVYSLDYSTDVPAGMASVPARSVMILRDPAGAPPPGEEPGRGGGSDGGVITAGDMAGVVVRDMAGGKGNSDGSGNADLGMGEMPGGCGCVIGAKARAPRGILAMMLILIVWRTRARSSDPTKSRRS